MFFFGRPAFIFRVSVSRNYLDGSVAITDGEQVCVRGKLHGVNPRVSVMDADFLFHRVFGEILLQLDA